MSSHTKAGILSLLAFSSYSVYKLLWWKNEPLLVMFRVYLLDTLHCIAGFAYASSSVYQNKPKFAFFVPLSNKLGKLPFLLS
jgi:hypothetical protein